MRSTCGFASATLLILVTLLPGLAAPRASIAQEVLPGPPIEVELDRIFETDSLYILDVAISPDGKWAALSAGPDLVEYSIFIAPVDGGELIRLTEGNFHDTFVRWAPDGRYIYFLSDRIEGPESGRQFVTRIPFDPVAGRATDVPRPVALESTTRVFSVSPDGDWVAYSHRIRGGESPRFELKVVPASGGNSQILAETETIHALTWTPDGSAIIYSEHDGDFYQSEDRYRDNTWRVPREGGEPEFLFSQRGRAEGVIEGAGQILWHAELPNVWTSTNFFFTDFSGKALGSFTLPYGVRSGNSGSPDIGYALYSGDSGMSVMVVPLNGEAAIPGPPLGNSADALAWMGPNQLLVHSADGEEGQSSAERVVTHFTLDPVTGNLSPAPEFDAFHLSRDRFALTEDLHYALVRVDDRITGGTGNGGTLNILDIETGVSREILQAPEGMPDISNNHKITGPGGARGRDGGTLFYSLVFEDREEVYSVTPPNDPELAWTFMGTEPGYVTAPMAVHGDRLAWIQAEADGPIARKGPKVMLGDLRTGEVQELFDADGDFEEVIYWSHDGTRLALGYDIPGEEMAMAVLEVGPEAAVDDFRIIRLGTQTWYDLQWLPDDESVAVLSMGRNSDIDTDVLLVNVLSEGGVEPVVLTEDDPYSIWTFELSPDGRFIAYANERPTTATLYRMRLPNLGGR